MPTATKDAPSRDLALRLAHHALRAPLTTLVGYAQLLSAAPLTASQRARAHDQLNLGAGFCFCPSVNHPAWFAQLKWEKREM